MNRLAWEERYSNRDSAISWASQSLKIAKKSGYRQGESAALTRLGILFKGAGDFAKALEYYNEALSIRKTLNHPLELAGAYNNIGLVLRKLGRYDQAIDSTKKAIAIAEALKDSTQIAKFSNNIGAIYRKRGSYKAALKSYHRTLRIRISQDDSAGLIHSYNNLGSFYSQVGMDKLARAYYDKSLDILKIHGSTASLASLHFNLGGIAYNLKEHTVALRHYNTSLELYRQINDSSKIPDIIDNIGLVYLNSERPDKALEYLKISLQFFERNGNDVKKFNALHSIGAAYLAIGQLPLANENLYNAYQYARKANHAKLLTYCLQDLATLHIELDEPQIALDYSRKYQKIQDSLKQYKEEVLDFDLTQRELQQEYMEQLADERTKEIEEQKAAKQQRNWVIIALGFGTLLLLVGGFFFVRWLRRRQVVELSETTETATRSGVVAGQESERKRIAVDLHDRLGSLLSLIKLQFSSQEELTDEQHKEYQRARSLVDQAVKEVGQIVWEMESGDLQELGLLPALKNLFQVYRELGLKIDLYHFDLYQRLGFEVEKNLFRIMQEVMNNIVKHAQASQVTTQLLVSEGNLNVVIEDDGVGFELGSTRSNGRFSGNGLKNIQLRVEALNGTMQLDSTPGCGTTIVIDVPVQAV